MSWYNQGYQDGSRARPGAPPATIRTCREYGLKVDEAEWQRGCARGWSSVHPRACLQQGTGGAVLGSAPATPASHPVPRRGRKGVPAGAAPRRIAAGAGRTGRSIHQLGSADPGRERQPPARLLPCPARRAIRHYEGVPGLQPAALPGSGDPVLLRADKGADMALLFIPQTAFPSGGQDPALQRQGDTILVVIRGDPVCMGLDLGAALRPPPAPPARTCWMSLLLSPKATRFSMAIPRSPPTGQASRLPLLQTGLHQLHCIGAAQSRVKGSLSPPPPRRNGAIGRDPG